MGKNIRKNLEEKGIKISDSKLNRVLSKCEKCKVVDKVYVKSSKYVETFFPGEVISMDLMDIEKKYKVIIAIDYFSRKIWGRVINNKEAPKIKQFVEHVYNSIKFKSLKTDNGREFNNKEILKFCKERNIERKLTVPYYHKSNGRVERAIRTIRTGLKKESGPLKVKVAKVIENYNKTVHRGTGLTPNEAMLDENIEVVKYNSEKYAREFKSKEIDKLQIGDKVYIRNDVRKTKMEDEWCNIAEVVEMGEHDSYIVKDKQGRKYNRHRTQLKISTGNVGCNLSI